MNLLALLRAKEPASADLRREISSLDISGKAAAVDRVRARRRQQLVEGEAGAALDKTERELTDAQREHDRAVALHQELSDRLTLAVRREHLDALAARKATVEREADEAVHAMRSEYGAHIDALAALVARDRRARNAVAGVNAELHAAGSTERVPDLPLPPVRIIDRLAELVPGGVTGMAR